MLWNVFNKIFRAIAWKITTSNLSIGSNVFGAMAEKSAKVFVQHCLSAVWGEQLALREGVRGVGGGRFYVFSLTQATISPGGKATWDKYKIIAEIYFRIPCLWMKKWSFYLRFHVSSWVINE
jgi:hypothetical protein